MVIASSQASASDDSGPAKTKVAERVAAPDAAEFFESRIRPILAVHCFPCHGPKKQESGLRLDSRERLLQGTDAGPVVVPGHPEESPLVEAIRYNAIVKMPPKSKLPPGAIADLTAWVQMGMPWPDNSPGLSKAPANEITSAAQRHWAFQPIRRCAPPTVKNTAWPQTSIDRFILTKLEARGLSPSRPAEKRTLLRRATFDLTGLPPTPEEVACFESDTSAGAFERLIDRLLASPHYGERWGRYWLDVARYADTKGYVLFQDANFHWAYIYRDYVINAFNHDLPYDEFVVEQIAADRLPMKDGKRPLAALGFLTLGGRFMGNVHDVIDDRLDVICRGLMSLTVTCARCHDHKFDPIPTEDYYSLYGVLASAREPAIPPEAYEPKRTEVYAKFVKELDVRQQKLSEFVTTKHREMISATKQRAAEYLVAAQQALNQPTTEDFMLIADGSDLNPTMLVRWQVYLERTRKGRDPVLAPWHALAALPEREFAVGAARMVSRLTSVSGSQIKTETGQTINPLIARSLAAQPPQSLVEAAQIYGKLLNAVEQMWQERVDRAVLDGRTPEPFPEPALESLRQVFHGPDSPPNVVMLPYGDLGLLPDRPSQAKLQELRNAVQTWLTTGPGAPPRALSLEEMPAPFEPRVFLRGNPNNLGAYVPRRVPAILFGSERKPLRDGGGRLKLARAVASPKNPLTARALVNRVWMLHFGAPLVATPGDFGLRSEPPTHPELLDHLACIFIDETWSIKALHRRIMLSQTYQQTSEDRSDARALDPENTLYWRANRRRLDFEAIRDALLFVSGRLDRRLGGPPMPDLTDATARRRTLYGFVDRLNLPGLYRTFDFPDPATTSPRRDQTTVAPQALFLMNHSFVATAARSILTRPAIAAEPDTATKAEKLFELICGRPPCSDDLTAVLGFLGKAPVEPKHWQALAQALLLTNEFIFVD
jgi:hypothetical protein